MRCFRGLCFQLWVFIELVSIQFLPPSVQFFKGPSKQIPSAFQAKLFTHQLVFLLPSNSGTHSY